MLARNRTTLAVLAALGFTRLQRRRVGLFASSALVFVGVVIGIPIGLVLTAMGSAVRPDRSSVAPSAVDDHGRCVDRRIGDRRSRRARRFPGIGRMTPSERLRVE